MITVCDCLECLIHNLKLEIEILREDRRDLDRELNRDHRERIAEIEMKIQDREMKLQELSQRLADARLRSWKD